MGIYMREGLIHGNTVPKYLSPERKIGNIKVVKYDLFVNNY